MQTVTSAFAKIIAIIVNVRWPTTVTAKQRKRVGQRLVSGWSAVGQRLFFASEMVRRVTVTHCSLEKPSFFELTMFCTACGSVVD